MRQSRDTHLECDARTPAENLANVEHFPCNSFRISDQQGACRSTQGIELSPRRWWPTSFLADLCEGMGVPRIEIVRSFLRRIAQESNRVQSYLQSLFRMASAPTCLTIQIDQRPKAFR